MSVTITNMVWGMDLPMMERMVLLRLADHADEFGKRAFPSVRHIGLSIGMSERSVQRSLASLRNLGLISITVPANSHKRLANEYALNLEEISSFRKVDGWGTRSEGCHTDVGGCQSDTNRDDEWVTDRQGTGDSLAPQPPSIHQKEEGDLTTFGLLGGEFPNDDENSHQRQQQALADRCEIIINEGVKIPRGVPAVEMLMVYNIGLSTRGLPRCLVLTRGRANKLSARFKDCAKSLEMWKTVLQDKVLPSNFLMGHSQARAGQEPFKASLDWIIGPENFVKIVEGNYVRQSTDYNGVK